MDAWICGYYFNRLSINQVCDMLFHDVSYTAKSVGRGFNCPLLLNYVKKSASVCDPVLSTCL